jgi:predicted type IV restriction endonuclease
LYPKRLAKEISLMKSGKDLNEDLKTLKDLGIQPADQSVTIMVSLRNQFEMDMET